MEKFSFIFLPNTNLLNNVNRDLGLIVIYLETISLMELLYRKSNPSFFCSSVFATSASDPVFWKECPSFQNLTFHHCKSCQGVRKGRRKKKERKLLWGAPFSPFSISSSPVWPVSQWVSQSVGPSPADPCTNAGRCVRSAHSFRAPQGTVSNSICILRSHCKIVWFEQWPTWSCW